jgi:hypothetical protein
LATVSLIGSIMEKAMSASRVGICVALLLSVCVAVGALHAKPQKQLKTQSIAALNKVLSSATPLRNAYHACLLNGLAQGLPIRRASDECVDKLDAPGAGSGGGVGGIPGLIAGKDPFDPSSVQANCSGGDARYAQTNSEKPVGYRGSDLPGMKGTRVGGGEGMGYGSYGGKGMKNEDGLEYRGLSKEESQKLKEDAMKEALKALGEYTKLAAAAKEAKDPAKKAELEKKAAEADKKWQEAHKKASEDPNLKEPDKPVSRTGPFSLCEATLQAAREILFECNRTDWKSAQCQSLAAKMNRCPDPKYIYVDPEVGYTCGAKIDPEAVKTAWKDRCEQRVKYGPGGDNPCEPPKLSDDGRSAEGNSDDICRDPRAYVDPSAGECIAVLQVKSPAGGQTVDELLVWARDKFGGPIFVLPRVPKPKEPNPPGPQPRPGPRG